MENRLLNWGIAAALATVGLSFWWMNKSWNTEVVVNPQDLSYEMPRPKAAYQGYDLSNRRFMQQLLARKEATTKTQDGKAPATPPAKKDPKLAKDKKANAKKTAANTKKKPQLGVRIIGAPKQGLSVIQEMAKNTETGMQPLQPVEAQDSSPKNTAADDQKEKRTAAEWKSLLMNNPTPSLANEFFRAFRSREVAANDFYSISEELLGEARADRQKAGLYLLKIDVSVRSFTVLVDHYTDQTPQELKQQIFAILKSYGQVAKFGILSRLLSSSDTRVVEMASQVLTLTVASQGPDGQDDNGSPGAVIPPASFRAFLPILTRLSQSDNATIAQQAQTLLQSIQNLLTA